MMLPSGILSGRDLRRYIDSGKLIIQPLSGDQFQQNGIDFILDDVQGHIPVIRAGMSVLGVTRETIHMPDDVMAFVAIRSTWARQYLSFHGLTIVDAGFVGQIVLELHRGLYAWDGNLVPDLPTPYGERFAHLIFAKTTSPCEPYNGKYQHQSGIQPAIEDRIRDQIKK